MEYWYVLFTLPFQGGLLTTISTGPAIFTCLGIYGCQDADVIADQSSTCNRIVALSEIAEWELSIGWVAYMCCIAYDLYHVDAVVRIWVAAGIDEDWGVGQEVKEGRAFGVGNGDVFMEGGDGVQVLVGHEFGEGDVEERGDEGFRAR